jgi:hypothetical protein
MSTTWFAIIVENDFSEFAQRVRGLGSSYAAYMAKLDRQEADWLAGCPDSEAIRVRVGLPDLERYCRHRGGSCAARELGRLANLKHAGQLWMNEEAADFTLSPIRRSVRRHSARRRMNR